MIELGDSWRPRGAFSRRGFLRVGCLGSTGLTLGGLLRAKATAGTALRGAPNDRSVILIWLDGGPPQHETYDPKPDAPAEFRGPLKSIGTAIPGVQVSELLPGHARLMNDHWGNVMSVLAARGGLARGRVVGASNARGKIPKDRPVRPQDLLVTL